MTILIWSVVTPLFENVCMAFLSLPPLPTISVRSASGGLLGIVAHQAGNLGSRFACAARQHPGDSAFRVISVGADGFRALVQLIDARAMWAKMRKSLGEKRRYLTDEQIAEITRLHGSMENGELA